MQRVHEVNKLTSLQELEFSVQHDSESHIGTLKTLNNLRRLSISGLENVTDPTEAKNANLSEKKCLLSLTLHWFKGRNSDNPEKIIDNLEPHQNLRDLAIQYYKGHRSPIWMRDLPRLYLSSLMLSSCPSWEAIPLIAQMPHLKKLSLLGMNEVKEVDYSSANTRNSCAFPSLKEMHFGNLPKWRSWAGALRHHGFPNLEVCTITDCPNLTELPVMPPTLTKFELRNVGLTSLPEIYHSSCITVPAPSSLREVEVTGCPNLISLNGFLQQENLEFKDMEKLFISSCENLVHLPTSSIRKFVSLKCLYIRKCPKLVPVDNQKIFLGVELQTLELGDCGELDVALLGSASQLVSLRTLNIEDSQTVIRIPCSENAFAFLCKLYIKGCDKLVQHSLMEIAQGVNIGNIMSNLKINDIRIPHLSLLFVEPFRSLRFVRTCILQECSDIEALPKQWLQQNCSTLMNLYIYDARSLRSLPDSMESLTALEKLYIGNATSMEYIPNLPPSLVDLTIKNASSLRSLPNTMVGITSLEILSIKAFNLLEQIPDLPPSLIDLWIENVPSLRSLPNTMVRLTSLEYLSIKNVALLEKIPELPSSLVTLRIENASSLRSLPDTMVRLTCLENLFIKNATLLEQVPELPTSLVATSITS